MLNLKKFGRPSPLLPMVRYDLFPLSPQIVGYPQAETTESLEILIQLPLPEAAQVREWVYAPYEESI